jgi:GNAT superfamily N-acetyltransferase
MLQIAHATTKEHFQQVQDLIAEMARWDAQQSQLLGLDPQEVLAFFYSHNDDALLREGAVPGGNLLLARFADTPAGCAAFHRIDARACELRHFYVRNEFRGRHIGRLMAEQLISTARSVGYQVMRLETAVFIKEAQALYASIGFRSRGPYRAVPKAFEPWTVSMELALAEMPE